MRLHRRFRFLREQGRTVRRPDLTFATTDHDVPIADLLSRKQVEFGENAVWALQDFGFKVIIASSFADIFKINCSKTGLLLVELHPETVENLLEKEKNNPVNIRSLLTN